MLHIIMQKHEDGAIWVTSDEDPTGCDVYVDKEDDEKYQFLDALARYFNVAIAI